MSAGTMDKSVMALGTGMCYLPGVKKPARCGLGAKVEFTDYLVWKFVVLVVAAFVWGFLSELNPPRLQALQAKAREKQRSRQHQDAGTQD